MTRQTPEEEARPGVADSGLLRAIRSEARAQERTRVRDMLSVAALAAEEKVARLHKDGRGRWQTAEAREAAGLRHALAAFDRRFGLVELTAGEPYLSLSGEVDLVELFRYDEPDEQGVDDPMPVRLAVYDGGEDSTACAYMSLDEAEQLFREGLTLVELIRQGRANRPTRAAEPTEGGTS